MSGQATKAVDRNLARSRSRPSGSIPESYGNGIWRRAAAAAGRVHDLSRARANGVKLQRVDLGDDLPDDRQLENDKRFIELLQRAHLDDGAINGGVALPLPFVSIGLTDESPRDSALRLDSIRSLDLISHSSKGVGRGMPPFVVAFFLAAALLLIDPGDYLGEIKGILAVLVPLGLYWLSQRSKRQSKVDAAQHSLTDEFLRLSADKEKRLDEGARLLRQEEREFAHSQIALSRERGHILARAYMSVWMKSEELIQLLHDHDVEVPRRLLTQETHAQVLGELKEVEDRQAGVAESIKERSSVGGRKYSEFDEPKSELQP